MRGTLHENRLKWFFAQNPEEIRPEDYTNKNNYDIKEVFAEKETPKEEAVTQIKKLITELLLWQT